MLPSRAYPELTNSIRIRLEAACHIRSCGIELLAIAGHSPLHASVGASLAHTHLPQDFAFAVGIESIDHAGLLPSEQNIAAIVEFFKDHRRSVIVVGAGTVAFRATRAVPDIAGGGLPGPADASGGQFKREP